MHKLTRHLCRLLKVSEITYPIARTSKGNLNICFNESDEFEVMLDAVPLPTKSIIDDENNIELKGLLEKYVFDKEVISFTNDTVFGSLEVSNERPYLTITSTEPKKKGGRPKGSKNHVHIKTKESS